MPDRRISRRSMFSLPMLLLVACGGDDSADGDGRSDVRVDDVLAAASERMADTRSMRFSLDVNGDTFIDSAGSIRLRSARGELARPDKVAVEFQISVFGTGNVSIRMITIGEESWTTDLITGDWSPSPPEFGYNPSVLYDNQNGLGPVLGRIDDATLAGVEDVDGRPAYHVSGSVTEETIEVITSNTMAGADVSIEVWIDRETANLLMVKVAETAMSGKDAPATWTMTLGDHDEDVSIAPPA